MRKIFLLLILPLALTQQAAATDITYADKSTGDAFTAADANEIKTAVNTKQDKTITDSGNIITATTVDTALQENRTAIDLNTAKDTNATHTGDVIGATALTIDADKVLESHLKAVDAAADEECLTYESTTGDFEWQICLFADGTVPMTADWAFGAFDLTGGVDTTWSGVGTFGTLSAGAAGFTVDADGDVTGKSFSMDATSTPTLSLADSESGDADQTSATIFAQVTTTTAGSVVSDVTHTYKDGSSASGVEAEAFHIDGANDAVEFQINTTLQAGDIPTAELADDAITFAKMDDDGVFGSFTGNWTWSAGTQTMYDLVVTNSTDLGSTVKLPTATFITTSTADYTAGTTSAAEMYGGVIYAAYTGDIILPAVTVGMSVTIKTVGAVAVDVDPNASDKMYLDGTLLDDGDKATNTSTTGDLIQCTYYSADGWDCISGSPDGDHWTDGS